MKKKLLSLGLVATMVLSLAACGSSAQEAAPAAEPAAEAAEAAPAGSADAAAPAAEAGDYPFDVNNLGAPVTLTVTCGFPDSEQGAQTLTWVMDQIEEISAGNITFDRYMGGSISTPLEDGANISEGASDFGSMLEATLMEKLPCWQYFLNANNDEQALGLVQEIVFDNPETSKILEEEAAAANLKVFAVQVTGHNGVVTREPISAYEELKGKTFGCEIGGDTWKNVYGASVNTISVTDEYESLSRGVVDATAASLTAIASNKWAEVAPYVLLSNATRASFWIAMNLDTYNSLTPDQQALIEYVAKQVSQYSVDYCTEFEAKAKSEMEAAGATITMLSDEATQLNTRAQYYQDYQTYSGIAAAMGKSEQFETIAQAALAYLGYNMDDLTAEFAK